MATDKIALEQTVEETNKQYIPVYKPLYSIFPKREAYDEFKGTMTFVTTDTVGDLKARTISTQDTESKHIAVGQDNKVYVKDFRGVNYKVSGYQKNNDINKITARVLEAFDKQLDEEIFSGNPDASGKFENNGIYGTEDKNVIKRDSIALPNKNVDTILNFFDALIKDAERDAGNAEKTVLLGGDLKGLLSKQIPNTSTLYKALIRELFNIPVNLVAIPSNLEALLPDGTSIAQVLTLDNISLKHSALPRLKAQGYDDEDEYSWFKFFYGTAMVDVEQYGASIIQPVTFA
ncbi:MAG: hypothetical protein LBV16_09340 [Elusimicrobiota bacterium]|nr:hypothetical protein [Elusimicrobiota bacterium]